jgi:hypothetical protein
VTEATRLMVMVWDPITIPILDQPTIPILDQLTTPILDQPTRPLGNFPDVHLLGSGAPPAILAEHPRTRVESY